MLSRVVLFPLHHWRGDVSLWPTLALTLVGLRLWIAANGGIAFLAADFCVYLWQVVGAWRALSRHLRSFPDTLSSVVGYGAIFISLLALLWPQLDRITRGNLPPVQNQVPATTGVAVTPSGFALSGDMDFAMFDAFEAALSKAPSKTRVLLNSPGGRVHAARAIARLIRENALDTHVDHMCASACTLAFIAGKERTLGASARLGFHGYSSHSQVQVVVPSEEEAKDRATFLASGVSQKFTQKMFLSPPRDMWFPDVQELREAGVIHTP